MNKTITVKTNLKAANEVMSYFNDFIVEKNSNYIKYKIKTSTISITCFTNSKNEDCKIVFQGKDPDSHALMFFKKSDLIHSEAKSKPQETKSKRYLPFPQMGSDEVGTGDFFGPIVVCAAIIKDENNEQLKLLGINDSKKITDKHIIEIAPKLMKLVNYSSVILDNEKYNKVNNDGNNMNKIKAVLHNKALFELKKRHKEVISVIIDEFCSEKKYYEYLQSNDEVLLNIHFETKAESKYMCVAAASVIARYMFLQHMNELGKKYNVQFLLGASNKVDDFAQKFVKKHGINKMHKVAKINFKNYTKLS